jgi:hypothetical protein
MVGTFDAANFGDVLFPVIARHELSARLGELELTAYGYRSLSADQWPYAVRSLGLLPAEIGSYDLLLIGGGLIVRDDPNVAPGYAPSDPRVHQPLGLWLVPALLAHAAGVPVAWNAVGATDHLADWLRPLAHAALTGSAYIAARDQRSAAVLAADRTEELEAARAADSDRVRELELRAATLERVLNGGWWRLRERFLPLLKIAGRVHAIRHY